MDSRNEPSTATSVAVGYHYCQGESPCVESELKTPVKERLTIGSERHIESSSFINCCIVSRQVIGLRVAA